MFVYLFVRLSISLPLCVCVCVCVNVPVSILVNLSYNMSSFGSIDIKVNTYLTLSASVYISTCIDVSLKIYLWPDRPVQN